MIVAAASNAAAAVIRVDVTGIAFATVKISAHVGDTIEWNNNDFVSHTATARDGQWDVKLAPHTTGRAVIKKTGRIEYYCRFHPTMKGEIDVTGK
jgi:plastocyanin